jgi:hypothetical protein
MESAIQLNELSYVLLIYLFKRNSLCFCFFRQVCSRRFSKRWSGSVGGPIAIDYINQMLEARKVKSYPYSAEMDPYLV